MAEIEIVRIYLTEQEGHMEAVVDCLHDECHVRGMTVFRGISGYGTSGRIHEARWSDLSLDLPVVVEFFDLPERAAAARDVLADVVPPGHIVYWSASADDWAE